MSYAIDTTSVNARIDWRLKYLPGPSQTSREEQYAGLPQRFVVSGPQLPPDILVSGTLEAATQQALVDLMKTYAALKSDGIEHAITINGASFAALVLTGFASQGEPFPISNDTFTGLATKVVFQWRQLRETA